MKGKILTLIIGILIGAILATGGFIIYNHVNKGKETNVEANRPQMEQNGERPAGGPGMMNGNFNGQKPEGEPPAMSSDTNAESETTQENGTTQGETQNQQTQENSGNSSQSTEKKNDKGTKNKANQENTESANSI